MTFGSCKKIFICLSCFIGILIGMTSCFRGEELSDEERFELLQRACENQEWRKALSMVQDLKKDGSFTEMAPFESACYLGLGDTVKAFSVLEEALEADTLGHAQYIYLSMGDTYCQIGDTLKAIDCYRRSLEASPGYARPYMNLGYIYQNRGEDSLAVENYLGAVRLFVEHEAYDYALECCAAIYDIDKACLESCKHSLFCYFMLARFDEAVQMGEYIFHLLPPETQSDDFYETCFFYGMSALHAGDKKTAEDLLTLSYSNEYCRENYSWLNLVYLSAINQLNGNDDKAKLYRDGAAIYSPEDTDKEIAAVLEEVKGVMKD